MSIQYHTRNGRSGAVAAPRRGAVSVGPHPAITFEYKRTMLSPGSDEKTLMGAQALPQPRARARIPCYVCQSNTTHAMVAQALVGAHPATMF